MSTDKRKRSVYLSGQTLDEITAEAERQGRSVSWLLQLAWKVAREKVTSMPHANGEGVQ